MFDSVFFRILIPLSQPLFSSVFKFIHTSRSTHKQIREIIFKPHKLKSITKRHFDLGFEDHDYLRVVYSLRYSQSEFRCYVTMRKRVSSRKLPWVLLLIHSQKQNLKLWSFENCRTKQPCDLIQSNPSTSQEVKIHWTLEN